MSVCVWLWILPFVNSYKWSINYEG